MGKEYLPQTQPVSASVEGANIPSVDAEQQSGASLERSPGGGEVPGAPQPAIQQVVIPRPAVPQPVPQATPVADDNTPPADDNPVTANDVDVIEKEWVDRAKLIVAQTKADPHEQEKRVSELQADYLKKRYGKEVQLVSE
jgi:hypothetical protein